MKHLCAQGTQWVGAIASISPFLPAVPREVVSRALCNAAPERQPGTLGSSGVQAWVGPGTEIASRPPKGALPPRAWAGLQEASRGQRAPLISQEGGQPRPH